MKNLRISIVQTFLYWENIPENLNALSAKLAKLKGETDLIILPEMFTTGFSMNAEELAESMNGDTMKWLKEQSAALSAAITGSFIIKEEGKFYNRLIFMQPNGQYEYYDKRHLFTLAKEDKIYQAGHQRLTFDWIGWKICPLVCYDLRFPVWSRNNEDYDLLIYVANWPETRKLHWSALLKARAIENQAFTIGVNRVGEDGNGYQYSGESTLIDYSGVVIYCVSKTEDIFTTQLSKEEQSTYRNKLNFLPDRDSYQIL